MPFSGLTKTKTEIFGLEPLWQVLFDMMENLFCGLMKKNFQYFQMAERVECVQ